MLWAKSTALSSTFTQVVLWHISILWEREEASMSGLYFLPRRHPGLQLHGSKSIHFCDFWVLGAYGRCGTPPQQSISDGYSTAHFNRDKLPRSQLILTIILSALLTYLLTWRVFWPEEQNDWCLEHIPPTQDSLLQHVKRVAYKSGIWASSELAQQPTPSPEGGDGHWMSTTRSGFLCGAFYQWREACIKLVVVQGAHPRSHTGIAKIFAVIILEGEANKLQFTSCMLSSFQCVLPLIKMKITMLETFIFWHQDWPSKWLWNINICRFYMVCILEIQDGCHPPSWWRGTSSKLKGMVMGACGKKLWFCQLDIRLLSMSE